MSRRAALGVFGAVAGGAALGGVLSACGSDGASPADGDGDALERELVIQTTGGAFDESLRKHFYDPFTAATGVRIVSVVAGTERRAKIKAMVDARRVEWDIVSAGDSDLTDPALAAYYADLGDCGALPNVAAQGVEGACKRGGVLRTIGGVVIAYNTEAVSTPPRSWADFWDVDRFPGPRGMMAASSVEPVMTALIADGVDKSRLFPLDLDRAFRKLDEIKPHVRVWWKTGDQSQQVMRDREVAMAQMWSGRALSLKAEGRPVDVEWNGAVEDVANWALLRDAPHPNAARAFLNFFVDRPQAHVDFSREMHYDTSNRKAVELLPSAEQRSRLTHPDNWKNIVRFDQQWLMQHRTEVGERWTTWLAG